ncbi:MAG: hypothetical protein ACR2JM_01175 [Mycobacterium sp.]
MRVRLASTLLVAAVLSSCPTSGAAPIDGTAPALPATAVITYSFTDSSVPPQYHRSWTMTVTRARSEITVASYGSVLAQRSAETAADVWELLVAGFPVVVESAEPAGQRTAPQGCTGGTTEAVRVEDGPDLLIDRSVYNCGGKNSDVAEALRAWIAPARSQFPPTDVMAPPG